MSSSKWRWSSSAVRRKPSQWYAYWQKERYQWYLDLGVNPERLRMREHVER